MSDGLLVGKTSEQSCCWVATHAQLTFIKPSPARRLILVTYLPDHMVFATRVTLTMGNVHETRCCLHGGIGYLEFPLPRALRSKRGSFEARVDSQPAALRDLAFVLVRAFFY